MQAACIDGACVERPRLAGRLPESLQAAGDCLTLSCDGDGKVVDEVDEGDVPHDGNPCTEDGCSGSSAVNTPLPGAPCGERLSCNESGICVGCMDAGDCPTSGPCAQPQCEEGQCKIEYQQEGTPIPSQTAGDCAQVVCNGSGGTDVKADPEDAPVSADCVIGYCDQSSVIEMDAPDNTPCGSTLGQHCCSGSCCAEGYTCLQGGCVVR
jgi:hypothetical protein